MTKAELIKAFQEATQLNGVQAEEYLNRLSDIMAAELLGGGEVPLPRVGKLYVKDVAARKGRNPQTGQPIEIAARKKLGVSAAKALKDALR